jgi:YVTN family beta-propeller protein
MRACLFFFALTLAAASGHRVTGNIPVGGEGGWDYLALDDAGQRLFISHATKVVVASLETSKVVGEIPDTPGVHGIALAQKLGKGYISAGRANRVTVFDLKTLKPLKQIAAGKNPDAILYEPGSNRVFVFNGSSHDATVIDAASDTVVATIPLGGKPEFGVADGKGRVYVNIEDTHEVAAIDVAAAKVAGRYTLTGCEEPSGLAMDHQRRRLFSVCGNQVMVISQPDSAKVIASLPIGDGSDGAAFDPGTGLAFSSNGEGTLTVVGERGGKYAVIETIKTQPSGRTITLDPKTHKIYIPAAEYGPTPKPTAQQPHPRPVAKASSFRVLIISK